MVTVSKAQALMTRYGYRIESKKLNLTEKGAHCLSLTFRIYGFKWWKILKANRWLAFVQGYLWTIGEYTVEELKQHNKQISKELTP